MDHAPYFIIVSAGTQPTTSAALPVAPPVPLSQAIFAPRIRSTNIRHVTISTLCIVLVVGAAVVTLSAKNWFAESTPRSSLYLDHKAPSKRLLLGADIRFTRLDNAQLSRVRITPTAAANIAIAQYGLGGRSHVTFESLGGYVDTSEIIPDWVGTTPWVPKAVPAYLVRIHGVSRWSMGPSPAESLKTCTLVVTASSPVVVAATCSR